MYHCLATFTEAFKVELRVRVLPVTASKVVL